MSVIARSAIVALILPMLAQSGSAEEKVYWDIVEELMDEAFNNSHVEEDASWLVDVFGPRNSKSSGYVKAANWAKNRLTEYGLANAHLEPFDFAVGWENKYTSVHMMAPQYMPIIAYPAAWAKGTNGKVRGKVKPINIDTIDSQEDLNQYKGKLKGLIIFTRSIQEVSPHFEYLPEVYPEEELDEKQRITMAPPESRERRGGDGRRERLTREEIYDFLFAEGVAAVVTAEGRFGFGIVNAAVGGYAMERRLWEADAPPAVTELVIAAEHYNRMMRIMEKGIDVEMELDVKVEFRKGEPVDHNVIAEIPGTDLAHEIVVIGAHLQSEPVGAGAIDNAAGCVIAMEAMRILKAIGAEPRRTIRIGLWGGHEMGTIGNSSHVAMNFADAKTKEYKKDYDNLSAYFNMDIGAGRTRAVSIMGNEEMRSILLEWMKPLRSIGMTHLYTTGSEHESYREVGLPGFYFDQDRRHIDDFNAHTNMDLYERMVPEGMMQSAVVLATFAYHAAMRDEKLPRPHPKPW